MAKVVLAGLIWPDLFAPYGDVSSVPPPSVALYSLLQLHCRGLLKEHIIILTRSTLWGLLLNTQTRACVCVLVQCGKAFLHTYGANMNLDQYNMVQVEEGLAARR